MRNNYDIKINPRQPSSEEIAGYRDFDALLEQYRQSKPPKRPQRRSRLLYISGAMAAAVVGLVLYFSFWAGPGGHSRLTAEEYFARQEFAQPPIPAIKPRFATQRIDARQGGAYEFSGGSRLIIPTEAFLDDRGRLIDGEVDIHYREMHDFVDFFVAGIPMVYDSADQRYYLESAGMIEIFALKNGRRVNLAPGKAIEVELVSEITVPNINVSPRYSIYKLDTLERRWVYQDVDHLQFIDGGEASDADDPLFDAKTRLLARLKAIEAQTDAEWQQLEKTLPRPPAPVKPLPQDKNRISLELNDLTEAARSAGQPGQAIYDGTIWQVAPRNPSFDTDQLNKVWEDVRVLPLNNLEYEFTFINGQQELRLIVMPVLADDDFDRAMRQYEEAGAAYQMLLAQRDEQLNAQGRAIMEAEALRKAEAQRAFEEEVRSLTQQGTLISNTGLRRRVINRFYATSLGIWNCDRPIPLYGEEIKAEFVDQHGTTYTNQPAYLVNRNKNTVYRFYTGEDASVQIDPDSENILWLLSRDNKIAILRPNQLREVQDRSGELTLLLQLVDKEIRSEEDIRAILEF